MGFPDDFIFSGTKTEIARQIGNAVPPDLAGAIAAVVKNTLEASKAAAKLGRSKRQTMEAEHGETISA
jgi:DNA (cytosine-5)-methyltransferase 1